MAQTFRRVSVTFWSDQYIASLTALQKLVFVYLLTNERTSYCGIYEITVSRMSHDLDLESSVVEKILDKFLHDKKITRNLSTGEIGMINWRKHNPENKKYGLLIQHELQLVKDKDMVSALMNPVEYTPPPSSNGEEKKEPPKKQRAANPPINRPFAELWTLYDHRVGDKKRAERLWVKLTDMERDAVMQHVPLFIAIKPDKEFRPHLATYLYQRRWENEGEVNKSTTTNPSKHENKWL